MPIIPVITRLCCIRASLTNTAIELTATMLCLINSYIHYIPPERVFLEPLYSMQDRTWAKRSMYYNIYNKKDEKNNTKYIKYTDSSQ